jgi:acyl carrier protein
MLRIILINQNEGIYIIQLLIYLIMTIEKFIENFAGEFDETPVDVFSASTEFKSLDEWNSLTALSVISMIDDQYDKTITGADLRGSKTIEDLFNLIAAK